jgi:large subunit ribosomal protein L17
MRHLKAGRKHGRNATHRLALFRNLALALFRHERIITTLEKAKEARRFVERLITLAKRNNLHARRLVAARLGSGTASAEVKPGDGDEADHRSILKKLFEEIAPRYADRPGGYTRVIKRTERRLGDGGKTAYLELLKAGETKVQKREPAPAPRVEDETPQQPPASETPPTEGAATPPAGETPPQPQGEAPPASGEAQPQQNPPPA